MCLYICVFLSVCLCLYVRLSVSVWLSVCLYLFLSDPLSLSLSLSSFSLTLSFPSSLAASQHSPSSTLSSALDLSCLFVSLPPSLPFSAFSFFSFHPSVFLLSFLTCRLSLCFYLCVIISHSLSQFFLFSPSPFLT